MELTAAAGCLLKALKRFVVLFFLPFLPSYLASFAFSNLGAHSWLENAGRIVAQPYVKGELSASQGRTCTWTLEMSSSPVFHIIEGTATKFTFLHHLKISIMEDNWAPTPPVRQRWPPPLTRFTSHPTNTHLGTPLLPALPKFIGTWLNPGLMRRDTAILLGRDAQMSWRTLLVLQATPASLLREHAHTSVICRLGPLISISLGKEKGWAFPLRPGARITSFVRCRCGW